MEDVIKSYKIQEVWRVLLICITDTINDFVCYNLQATAIIPQVIEQFDIGMRHRCLCFLNHGISVITLLTT